MSGAGAHNRGAAPQEAALAAASAGNRIFRSPARHAPFGSSRPAFASPDEYHRFAGGGGSARGSSAEDDGDALVARTPVSLLCPFLS